MAQNNIFQPELTPPSGTAVTVKEPVVDAGSDEFIRDIGGVLVEGGKTFVGHKELTQLQGRFDKISQLRQTGKGGGSSALQTQAIIALRESKANAPWIAGAADEAFRATFGGGPSGGSGGGSIFKATPEEEAQADYQKRLQEVKLALNLPNLEEAAKVVALEAQADQAKNNAILTAESGKANTRVLSANVDSSLLKRDVAFQANLTNLLRESGGTIQPQLKPSLKALIRSEAIDMRADLVLATTDKNGRVIFDNPQLEPQRQKITDWETDTLQQIEDDSYSKLLSETKDIQDAETSIFVKNNFRMLIVAKEAGGQGAVNAFIEMARETEATRDALFAANPSIKLIFGDNPDFFNTSATQGVNKLVVPIVDNILTETEAFAIGALLNSKEGETLFTTINQGAAKNPSLMESLSSLMTKMPDAANLYLTDQAKSFLAANKGPAKRISDATLLSLRSSFHSAYLSSNVGSTSLPSDISIVFKSTNSQFMPGMKTMRVSGEGITPESAGIVRNTFRLIQQVPSYKESIQQHTGLTDVTDEELVSAFFNGVVPSDVPSGDVGKDEPQGGETTKGVTEAIETLGEEDSRAIIWAELFNAEDRPLEDRLKDFNAAQGIEPTSKVKASIRNAVRTNAFSQEMFDLGITREQANQMLLDFSKVETSGGTIDKEGQTSPTGAVGILQVLPSTAKDLIKQGQFGDKAAKAVGKSLDEIKALSDDELKELLLNDDNVNAMFALAKVVQSLQTRKGK